MPRPRTLTTVQIATAALEVVDQQGLDVLSMRTVAQHLGVAAMSLYRYVADRDELERQMVDLVLGQVDSRLPRGSGGHQIIVLAERVRALALQHPALVPLLLIHRHRSPVSVRWGENVLEVLTREGLAGVDRVHAFRAILAYIFGAVQAQQLGPLDGPETATLAALPVAEYPMLVATAADAVTVDAEAEFRGGLKIVLRGLGI
jgi:AcrR family transcriptional regulator